MSAIRCGVPGHGKMEFLLSLRTRNYLLYRKVNLIMKTYHTATDKKKKRRPDT